MWKLRNCWVWQLLLQLPTASYYIASKFLSTNTSKEHQFRATNKKYLQNDTFFLSKLDPWKSGCFMIRLFPISNPLSALRLHILMLILSPMWQELGCANNYDRTTEYDQLLFMVTWTMPANICLAPETCQICCWWTSWPFFLGGSSVVT